MSPFTVSKVDHTTTFTRGFDPRVVLRGLFVISLVVLCVISALPMDQPVVAVMVTEMLALILGMSSLAMDVRVGGTRLVRRSLVIGPDALSVDGVSVPRASVRGVVVGHFSVVTTAGRYSYRKKDVYPVFVALGGGVIEVHAYPEPERADEMAGALSAALGDARIVRGDTPNMAGWAVAVVLVVVVVANCFGIAYGMPAFTQWGYDHARVMMAGPLLAAAVLVVSLASRALLAGLLSGGAEPRDFAELFAAEPPPATRKKRKKKAVERGARES